MFFLSKTIDHFLLPPGLFVLALAGIAVFSFRRRVTRIGWFAAAVALVLWLLSTEVMSRALLRPLESAYGEPELRIAEAEAIVVLGGGTVEPVSGAAASLTADPVARLVRGVEMHERTGLPIVFSGGTVFEARGGAPEAVLAGELARRLGIREEHILLESESRNTWENASNVINSFGFDRIVLVTSAYHMRRAHASFERQGVAVLPVAADFKADSRPLILQSFLPDFRDLGYSATALHEYVGLLYYRIRYRSSPR